MHNYKLPSLNLGLTDVLSADYPSLLNRVNFRVEQVLKSKFFDFDNLKLVPTE
jgi:hypothetical protein